MLASYLFAGCDKGGNSRRHKDNIRANDDGVRFSNVAEARGLKTVGGLGMLVHQGRASFKLWTGVEPEAPLFYAAAREQLARRAAKG